MTPQEAARLAAMGNALRPDWPASSLLTYLTKHHATRAYRDLAIALAVIATDPTTQTPARLAEAGPWWKATALVDGEGFGKYRTPCPYHPGEKAGDCPTCARIASPDPAAQIARVRQAIKEGPRP